MFKKRKPKVRSNRIDTLIGQGTEIMGNICFSGGLRIDGSVSGNIYTLDDDAAVLTLSERGIIQGEIKVPNLIINGTITGNVYSTSHVELAPKAKIKGNVYYRLLEMSMGAEVNGQLIHMEDDAELTNIQFDAVDAAKDAPKLDHTSD
jgi:cytoskeletal protein CcmA (bactofilin family)